MQNYEEIPTIDLSHLEDDDLEDFIYVIGEICEQLSKENYVIIKITKNED